jgi:DNA-binding transcriptional ArsR family regulator
LRRLKSNIHSMQSALKTDAQAQPINQLKGHEVLTVSDLSAEFGVSHNAIRYHLRDLFPANGAKHFKLRGADQVRARKYLSKVLQSPQNASFSSSLIAELTAIAGVYGVTLRALQTDLGTGSSRTLAVVPVKEGAPRVQIISSQTEVLAAPI